MNSRKTSTMTRFFVITALFLLFTNGAGAVPVEEWNMTFVQEKASSAFYAAQTSDEGYIVAGSTNFNESPGYADALLIKTDSKGKVQWNRTYAGTWIHKVSTIQDGGYIVKGYNKKEFWLLKTDSSGQELWNRTLSVKNITYFIDIEDTTDGGSIIAAVEALPGPWWNSRLIKVDASGNEQWNITLKRQHEFQVWSVQQNSEGGYVLAGTTFLSKSYYPLPGIPLMVYGDDDILLIKTDANGNKQWEKTFGWWGEGEGARSVVKTRDGGYIIEGVKGGSRLSPVTGDVNVWLIKTDESGNEQWNKVFEKSWEPYYSTLVRTSDGGYIFAGATKYDAGEIHDWLIKTDTNGNLQWKKVLGGEKYKAYSVQETSEHGYIIAGSTESYGSGNSNAWLAKMKDTSTSETAAADLNGSDKESTSGFEISGAIVSLVIIVLLVRKRF